uniref:Deoxyribonuclease-1-like 1 n=1 Tax=Geotrypetes seraphini TaxID=260995 RepID=A0A6P8P4N8_GEOSA|nr:deoxyribonuclease-1-like 1 isoform X3 [Geotrypetes seraphini]
MHLWLSRTTQDPPPPPQCPHQPRDMGGARLLVIAALLFHHLLCCSATSMRICAFNIQRFGETKAAKSSVMSTLVKILLRYDICLLQEIQDIKEKTIPRLVEELNRSDKAKVLDSYIYEDNHPTSVDVFAREPYIVRFSLPTTAIKDLVLVPQHTTPSDAVKEIDALYDVFLDIQKRWNAQSIIFLGDFNAGCDYVAKKNWPLIRLRMEPGFHWLIGDDADTTVKKNRSCAYDRIVVYGEKCYKAVIPGSAGIFDFLNKFGLLEIEGLEISDHYPVEVELSRAKSLMLQNWLFILVALVSAFSLGCFELTIQTR